LGLVKAIETGFLSENGLWPRATDFRIPSESVWHGATELIMNLLSFVKNSQSSDSFSLSGHLDRIPRQVIFPFVASQEEIWLFRECHQHRDDYQNEFHQNSEYDTEKILIETLRNKIDNTLDKCLFNIIVYLIDPLINRGIDWFIDSLIDWSSAWARDGL
jgi:hypothetical protein